MSYTPGHLAAQLEVSCPSGLHSLRAQLAVSLPEQSVGLTLHYGCSLLPALGSKAAAFKNKSAYKGLCHDIMETIYKGRGRCALKTMGCSASQAHHRRDPHSQPQGSGMHAELNHHCCKALSPASLPPP